jgi:hypothetical protein
MNHALVAVACSWALTLAGIAFFVASSGKQRTVYSVPFRLTNTKSFIFKNRMWYAVLTIVLARSEAPIAHRIAGTLVDRTVVARPIGVSLADADFVFGCVVLAGNAVRMVWSKTFPLAFRRARSDVLFTVGGSPSRQTNALPPMPLCVIRALDALQHRRAGTAIALRIAVIRDLGLAVFPYPSGIADSRTKGVE